MKTILSIQATREHDTRSSVVLNLSRGEMAFLLTPKDEISETITRTILGFHDSPLYTVLLFGLDPSTLPVRELQKLRQQVGVVFATEGLLANLSVVENILLPILFHKKLSKSDAEASAIEALKEAGYTGNITDRPSSISLLQKKQVMLARTILTAPELIIYDSIFTGLNQHEREAIAEVIISHQKKSSSRASLFLTADPSTSALIPAATMIQLSPEQPS